MHLFIPNLKNTIRKMTNCWHFVNKFLQKFLSCLVSKIIIRYGEEKNYKKKKETDYQRRYKNEWIAHQNIYSSMEAGKYIIFFIYKNFLFITLLFVQESNKNFTVNNSFRIIKRSISFRTDFRQIMSMIFFWEGDSLSRKVILTRVVISRGGTSAKLWVDIYCLAVWSLA